MRVIAIRFLTCSVLALSLGTAAAAQGQPGPEPEPGAAGWAGTWANGNNTMHVRAARCGDAMCGTVVWADDKTQADIAAKGRTLIGTQVFRNFREVGPNVWKGQVYVPAIDKTITGKIQLTDAQSITASACAFGIVGCETRHYRRIR